MLRTCGMISHEDSRITASYAESDTLESLKLAVGFKPIPRQWALSHPRLLFTQSYLLPYNARRTPRHRRVSCKVLHSFCSLPSSVTSLKLCDFLLLFLSPNSIFTWDVWLAEKSLLSQTKSHIHSAESLFSCLINHLNFSSACATHPVVGWFPPELRLKRFDKCYLCLFPVPSMKPPLSFHHVNKLMTLIHILNRHIPLRHLMVYSYLKGRPASRLAFEFYPEWEQTATLTRFLYNYLINNFTI